MNKLSTGQDSTLASYLGMTKMFFGEDSAAVEFLNKKVAESPNGVNEEVVAAESQMLYLLAQIHLSKAPA
jgi:hypothetical protein